MDIIIAVICFKTAPDDSLWVKCRPRSAKGQRRWEKAAKSLTDPEHRVISENCGKFLLKPTSSGGRGITYRNSASCCGKVCCANRAEGLPTSPFKKKLLSLIHALRRKLTRYLILIKYVTFLCQEITLQLCIIHCSGQDLPHC